jgi:hypothetical protein
MWDLLDVFFDCLGPVLEGLDLEEFWRFSLCFFASLILSGIVELASSQSEPLRTTFIVVVGTVTGAFWEWRTRRRGP